MRTPTTPCERDKSTSLPCSSPNGPSPGSTRCASWTVRRRAYSSRRAIRSPPNPRSPWRTCGTSRGCTPRPSGGPASFARSTSRCETAGCPVAAARAAQGDAVGERADRRRRSVGAGERGGRGPVSGRAHRHRLSPHHRASHPLLDRARLAPEGAPPGARPGRGGAQGSAADTRSGMSPRQVRRCRDSSGGCTAANPR